MVRPRVGGEKLDRGVIQLELRKTMIRIRANEDGTYTVYRGLRVLAFGLTRRQAEAFTCSTGDEVIPLREAETGDSPAACCEASNRYVTLLGLERRAHRAPRS